MAWLRSSLSSSSWPLWRCLSHSSKPPPPFGALAALQDKHMVHEANKSRVEDEADLEDAEAKFRAKIEDTNRPRPHDYLRQMNALVRQSRLREALQLLDVDMKRKELVKPGMKHYRVLINACAKQGYHVKALQLLREYESRDLELNFGIYADVFNACANSPESNSALPSVLGLRKRLVDRFGVLPKTVYHMIIKALGRCGDLESSFSVLDEMMERRQNISESTLNALLSGCIQDKHAGFRHALMAFRQVVHSGKFKVRPDALIMNLMIRASRDCGLGEECFLQDLVMASMSVEESKNFVKRMLNQKEDQLALPEGGTKMIEQPLYQMDRPILEECSDRLQVLSTTEQSSLTKRQDEENQKVRFPNLLEKKPDFRSVIALTQVLNPRDRFLLLGGVEGFCAVLKKHEVQPDVKTFSLMIDLLDDDGDGQMIKLLLDKMTSFGVKPDIEFFNQLIIKRARGNHSNMDGMLELIRQHDVSPNHQTFFALAHACYSKAKMFQLLRDIREMKMHPGSGVLGVLLSRACHRDNPQYVLAVLKLFESEQIAVSSGQFAKIERFVKRFNDALLDYERGRKSLKDFVPSVQKQITEHDCLHWREFRTYYDDLLRRSNVAVEEHPFRQFLTDADIQQVKKGNRKFKAILGSKKGQSEWA